MSTAIQWTDETWNPVTGCTKVSPGCAHCYAETVADRFWAKQYPLVTASDGDGQYPAGIQRLRRFTDVQCHPDRLDVPLRWRKPRRVFVNSMSDLFHEAVPDEFIDRVFAVMALLPWHTFQVLTKRAERMRDYLSVLTFERVRVWMNRTADGQDDLFKPNMTTIARQMKEHVYKFNPADMPLRTLGPPFPNVWLGVSVENQRMADERIPLLTETPVAVRFISAEPLLEEIDLSSPILEADCAACLDWVIVGGESGPYARPCDLAWVRSIREQCRSASVPCFVKQLGTFPAEAHEVGTAKGGCYLPVLLRDRKGGDPSEWPEDLRGVREFPA